ncbi:TPA: biotin/lipoyl-binding protein, partial [Salmonella enterica]|nr:biotin/lipoyl-binding protein [Salmonella enterica]
MKKIIKEKIFRCNTPLNQKDLNLLNDLNAALQSERSTKSFALIIMLFIFLVFFIIWAWNSRLDEVTRGQGSIIPSSREQIIQTLDAGILKEMKVQEGDIVEKGQILLVLDDTRTSAILRESEVKVDNLKAMRARLTAEAYSTELKFPIDLPSELVNRETIVYKIRKEALESSISNLQKSKALLDKEITITKPIVMKGAMSAVELIRMQRQSSEIQTQIDEKKNKYLIETSSELVKIETELAQAKEN